jgi:hypothetical protein
MSPTLIKIDVLIGYGSGRCFSARCAAVLRPSDVAVAGRRDPGGTQPDDGEQSTSSTPDRSLLVGSSGPVRSARIEDFRAAIRISMPR